jgi:hypothetical protein
MRLVILTLVLSISLLGQTFSPKQPVDFSAVTTKPIQVGTSAPGTCAVGQVYFDSDATAGQNLYLCTATNTWTQLTGTGGSGGTGIVICTGGGTSTAYTCTASGLTVATGAMVLFIPHVNSGASPGLAVNGGSSAPIIRRNGNGVVADELKEDIEYILTYTGSAWRLTQPSVTIGSSLTGILSVNDDVLEKEAGLCSTTDACAPTGGWDFAASAFLRIKRGTGAPSSADCNEAAEVGRIYARTDAETAKATFYGCANTAAATYAWEVIGDGGSGSGLGDPGSDGIVKRTALNTTAPATASDVSGLFSGTGDCLKSDGTKGDCGTGGGSGTITRRVSLPIAFLDANAHNHVMWKSVTAPPVVSPDVTTGIEIPGVGFPHTGALTIQSGTWLPATWTGTISARIYQTVKANTSGTGTTVLAVRTACITPGTDNFSPTFTSATQVQVTYAGADYLVGKLSTFTLPLGTCAANDYLVVRVTRDPATYTADDAAEILTLIGFTLDIQETF